MYVSLDPDLVLKLIQLLIEHPVSKWVTLLAKIQELTVKGAGKPVWSSQEDCENTLAVIYALVSDALEEYHVCSNQQSVPCCDTAGDGA